MLEDIPRPGLWKRLLLGAALVVFASAGATAVAAFHEVDKIVDKLELGPELKLGKGKLATTDPGKPQTLMILGSDRRPKNNSEGALGGSRSDTIMLVRLDPGKKATAILSLPRDLKVEIPGHGTDKINAAYELGGPALTLETVKAVTRLPINHVINVHFNGFWRAVNAVGCVYADIDRRYYNDSAEYSYINVQPGYQRHVRDQGAPVRPLPPRGHGHRPRSSPAGFPAPGQAADHRLDAVRQQGPADDDLRPQHEHRLGAAIEEGGPATAQARALLGDPADPGGQLPRNAGPELRRDHRRPDARK